MKYLKMFIQITLTVVKSRPTKYFWFVIASLFLLFLQAYMHNFNIVFIVMFFIFSIAGASGLLGRLNIYFLEVAYLSNERFFANEVSKYRLQVTNNQRNSSYSLEFINDLFETSLASIKPHEQKIVELDYQYQTRGEKQLPDLTIKSTYPLPHEFFYRDKIKLDTTVIVFPKPEGISLFATKLYNPNPDGEIDDFEGIRRFNEGESLSMVHWASFAKSGEFMSKKFLYQNEDDVIRFVFKDIEGDDEFRLSQLTLWVLECEANGLAFSIEIDNQTLQSKEMSIFDILSVLGRY
ncbi:MAG: DUF58 domain-containing protein [Campylobacterales bacterium]|nr:DUF58 domain-containing protein [Campylobacterales bacterium]